MVIKQAECMCVCLGAWGSLLLLLPLGLGQSKPLAVLWPLVLLINTYPANTRTLNVPLEHVEREKRQQCSCLLLERLYLPSWAPRAMSFCKRVWNV